MMSKNDGDWFKFLTIETIRSTLVNITTNSFCVRVVMPSNEDDDRDSDCVSESLSSLLAARALMKDQATTDESWQVLEGIMRSQGSNGFLPKFSYYTNITHSVNKTTSNSPWYLSSELFSKNGDEVPPMYLSNQQQRMTENGFKLTTSGRIGAVPFHSSFVLDTFLLSPQLSADVRRLEYFFKKLWKWHEFLHSISIPTNCPTNPNNNSTCFNVLHPWETIFPFHPQYTDLQYWTQILQPQYVPEYIKTADYQTIHKGLINLLQCQQKSYSPFSFPSIAADDAKIDDNMDLNELPFRLSQENKIAPIDQLTVQQSKLYEANLVKNCNFAMMDVTYAAALAQSDRDLQQILNILSAKMADSVLGKVVESNKTLNTWIKESTQIYKSTYSNKNHVYLSSKRKIQNHKNTSMVSTEIIEQPVAFNFMGTWVTSREKQIEDRNKFMTFLMLEKTGNFSFNCDQFPLPLRGDCEQVMMRKESVPIISPSLNYLLSLGMKNNDFLALSSNFNISTIFSVCRLPSNSFDYSFHKYCNETYQHSKEYKNFSIFPPFLSSSPHSMNPDNPANYINVTSSATAATVYNLLVPDPPFFAYTPNPPIRSVFVLVIIITELIVALGIGVSCLVLNLNLMRRLKREDDNDAFVRRLHDRRTLLAQLYGQPRDDTDEDIPPMPEISEREHGDNSETNASRSRISSALSSVQDYVSSFGIWQRFSSTNPKPPSPPSPSRNTESP